MFRVCERPDGTLGVQLIDGDFVTEVVGDDASGLEPGYYSDDGVFVRSLEDEPVVFGRETQSAHS
jgi:hypothetical protein